ncbi:mitochondrial import protein Pam17 [Periconia macrospinosa]|uniref:Presequence translocated-associated motor subunit PAM17 n=1 Tax=Periconia macrospinosa TaxID=97972 RepID=A0A2V1DZT8_9PLEO|nr:mitochondrial import protein Pam17 [Periconia macrospinosa]
MFASSSLRPARAFATIFPSPVQTALRHASSASQTTPPSSAASAPAQLTWNDFLALRRTRRKINVVASGFTSIATLYSGLRVFIEGGYDATLSAMLGIDPLMVTGLSSIAMLAAGWLLGPVFGGAIFNMYHRGIRGEILNKEREFFNRIKSHRVDPTSSSMNNPVPDYYGEKIGSLADYRRWLKDQRAFKLKRGAYQPK